MKTFGSLLIALCCISLFFSKAYALTEIELLSFNSILPQQNHVTGNFEQIKTLAILPMPILSSGKFSFDQKTGLNWMVLKPIRSQMILDDAGIRQIQNGKVVWSLDSQQPAASHISLIIASVLAADWNILSEHFDLSINEQSKNSDWIINLLPKSQVLLTAIKRIEMTGSKQLKKMELFEASGDSTVIIFNINPSQ
jgi:hypothetical protein